MSPGVVDMVVECSDGGGFGLGGCGGPAAPTSALSALRRQSVGRVRLKEERKKAIRALDSQFRLIDSERAGLCRFVLIRNNLFRLQREVREERMARHRAHQSPSSPYTPRRTFSCAFPEDTMDCKRLCLEEDKENSALGRMEEDRTLSLMEDTQEILRDLYETCKTEVKAVVTSPDRQQEAFLTASTFSLPISPPQGGSASPCGSPFYSENDLQSVVFHSLIAAME